MKKFGFLLIAAAGFLTLPLTGSGGAESKVIEAPAVVEDETAIEGMSDDEYNAAMDADMNG